MRRFPLLTILVFACAIDATPQDATTVQRVHSNVVPWTITDALRQREQEGDEFAGYVAIQLAGKHGEAERSRVVRRVVKGSEDGFGSPDMAELNLLSLLGGGAATRESLQLEQAVSWKPLKDASVLGERYNWLLDGTRDDETPVDPRDSELATTANLKNPQSITVAPNGDLIIYDFGAGRIRRVDQSGIIDTVQDVKTDYSFNGDGLCIDKNGDLIFADVFNSRIIRVTTDGSFKVIKKGRFQALVDEYGTYLNQAFHALDVAASQDTPRYVSRMASMAVDRSGVIYFVETSGQTHQIQRIDQNGKKSLLVTIPEGEHPGDEDWVDSSETYESNDVYHPEAITSDDQGNLYFTEKFDRCVKKMTPEGQITIVAGKHHDGFGEMTLNGSARDEYAEGDGGPATEAKFIRPHGLATDRNGNLYISDLMDHCVRMVDTEGKITTVAGTTSRGFSGDNGPATSATLSAPRGLVVDASGNLYIADYWNHRIRKVDQDGVITTVAGASDPWEPNQYRYSFQPRPSVIDQASQAPVPINSLRPPRIPSHPFHEMLAGQTPETSDLARFVPAEFYYIHFDSFADLLGIAEYSAGINTQLQTQSLSRSFSGRAIKTLRAQLGLVRDKQLTLLDQEASEACVAGNDLYWGLGTDLSVVFQFDQQIEAGSVLEDCRRTLLADDKDATEIKEIYRGQVIFHVSTPDHRVHFYDSDFSPRHSIRSNSLPALKRMLDVVTDKSGDPDKPGSLADSHDFQYVRTLMPLDSPNEDAFLFLSDAFIRRQIGPELRIKQQRRLQCAAGLRLIQHACLMHHTQMGHPAKRLSDLSDSGSLDGVSAESFLPCPDGGGYELDGDGIHATCSFHGSSRLMRPCCELELTEATGREQADYKEFVDQYSNYWREFFDPIGIQVALDDQRYRLETVILPLIRNSIYEGLLRIADTEPTDSAPHLLPDRVVVGVALKFNAFEVAHSILSHMVEDPMVTSEEAMFAAAPEEFNVGNDEVEEEEVSPPQLTIDEVKLQLDRLFERFLRSEDQDPVATQQIGLGEFLLEGLEGEVGLYICDARPNFQFDTLRILGGFLSEASLGGAAGGVLLSTIAAPVYVSLPLKDLGIADRFLDRIDPILGHYASREYGEFFPLDIQYSLFKIGETDIRSLGIKIAGLGTRAFVFRQGKTVYIASQLELVHELIDAHQSIESRDKMKELGHARAWIWPRSRVESVKSHRFSAATANAEACRLNLTPLNNVLRADQSLSIRELLHRTVERDGVDVHCPSGGRYKIVHHNTGAEAVCPIHGNRHASKQLIAPAAGSDYQRLREPIRSVEVTAELSSEGLRATLSIDRQPSGE
ncbi:hypothetical protein CKO51_19270 [Rhodopirellula sp. SM50]|nr:hypothetical protein [Rhodopirellula sp. SM50]PAY17835.1 hypothetical protein CKO51_19270 [Rhodopirellula sp. SM50]